MSTLRFVPGMRRFRRGEALIQFGVHEHRAKILVLPDPKLFPALTVFDTGRDPKGFRSEAKRHGADPEKAEAFLTVLQEEGILVDTRTLTTPGGPLTTECRALALRGTTTNAGHLMRTRAQATIDIEGQGQLVTTLLTELTGSGLTRTRTTATGARTQAQARSKQARPRPSLSILVDVTRPAGLISYGYRRRGVPYLVVTRMDGIVRIGPLVTPTTPDGACGNCVELRRRDRGGTGTIPPTFGEDTSTTSTRNEDGNRNGNGNEEELLERAVRSMAVGILTAHILTHIDGGRSPLIGATIDITPTGITQPETWTPHPDCGCQT
ncbi:hypothetical protein Afil01_62440 [Actinorhabdospora filicis]|uniref:Bacteriocin biosynthesis cyclodehydratase domain-containing protein n=1 Tax=Actinorhabdospora filicis TaxID=1785913 RepID=A0A9W6STA5_9ACTN|nr:hypothetical protein [Actinorhabdospora filicis]GLZ81437.1 hypothetical protein Afil01_62440 [Actinorhabdospora filicis]